MAIGEKELLTYYQTVRQAIQGFDALITNILTTGGTVTVGILVAPMAIFKTSSGNHVGNIATDENWLISFAISIFAVLVALYVFTAIALYADLLNKAVGVGRALENEIFKGWNEEKKLTTYLDKNPMAGGKHGTPLYLFMAGILYFVTGLGSTYYIFKWDPARFYWWLWPVFLIIIFVFWCCFLYRSETFTIDWGEARAMFKKVFKCSK